MTSQNLRSDKKLPEFPHLFMALAILLTCFTLSLFVFVLKQRHDDFKYDLPILNRVLQIEGMIPYLDEVLTMSARMSAETGNRKWETRYNTYYPVFAAAIKELATLTPKEYEKSVAAINVTSDKLLDFERRSFNLVNQGKLNQAKQLIYSQEYEISKNSFTASMENYFVVLQNKILEESNKKETETRYLLAIIFLTFGFKVTTWIFYYRNTRRWKMALDDSLQDQLKYQKELEASQVLLEQRVHKRTLQLNEKNQKLSATLQNLEAIQKKLIQSEKMSLVGQLSAGVAHEINNPLSFVMINMSILSKRLNIISQLFALYQNLLNQISRLQIEALEASCNKTIKFINDNKISEIVADLDDIISESSDGLERIKKIVSNLGSFANIDKEIIAEININQCIESAIDFVWIKLKYRIEVHKNLSELPLVNASYNLLQLAIISLLLNAVQAIKDRGQVTVESRCVNSNIIIKVSDNGCGIAPENISNIFTPFFTTKPIGNGMGLGLTTVFGIIQFHGGKISVESKLGEGSTFTLEIPVK